MTQNTRKTGELLGSELEGVNQILPHMHPWAWQLYLDGAANNWMPTEVPMAKDITNWAKLSDDEKLVVKRNLGFFAGSESLVANNLFALAKHITDPECRQFMARQQYEECYVDGTEVYTQNGWVKFQDLQPNDKVLQYNPDGSTEFVNYTNPVARHHDGHIYNLVDVNSLDGSDDITLLSVTPGHRMIWRNNDGSLKESTAKQIYNSGLQNTNKSNYANKNHIVLNPDDYDDYLASQCELVADDYSGMVYCVTVSSGMLIVRYNGVASISGNCLHNHTIVYICDSLDLDINEVYAAYANIPTIKAKDDFLMRATNDLNRPDFSTATLQGKRDLYKGAFTYWIICEGIFFYSGFAMLLSMSDKIPGIAEQIAYTLRDECLVDGTEVLTESRGWVKFQNLNKNDKVLSFTQNGSCEYVNYSNYVAKPHKGDIYHLVDYEDANEPVLLSVTPNHRMIWQYQDDTDMLREMTAKDMFNDNNYYFKEHITLIDRNGERLPERLHNVGLVKDAYEGMTYCVTVPSGMLVVRYNDTVSITGNSNHISFGVKLLNTLRQQYPDIVDDNFEKELTTLLKEAVRLEIQYAEHVLPRGILGLNSEMFIDYMQYIGNRRLEALGMKYRFDSDKNPFPWLAEKIDIQKQKNFFETRVTDYASASVLDDDF